MFLFLYRNHIHKTSHFLTKKNNIYNIYISLIKEKRQLCKSSPVSLCPVGGSRGVRGGLPAGLCCRALPAGRVVQSSGGHGGGGLYLDVSMFSSLKLPQCSITFLETTGERESEGGLGWVGHVPPG